MEFQLYMMLYLVTVIFTVASFIWNDRLFLAIMAFSLWQCCALLGGNLTYMGWTSAGFTPQSYEAGDPELPASMVWINHGIGIMMLVWGFGNLWTQSRRTLNDIMAHKKVDVLG